MTCLSPVSLTFAPLAPAAFMPATLTPATLAPAPQPGPVSYFFIRTYLDRFEGLGSLYHWFKGQGCTLPLTTPKAFIREMLRLILDETFFPPHVVMDVEHDEIPDHIEALSDTWPFLDFVHLNGLEWENGWDSWSELYKFCICLTVSGNELSRLDFSSWPYRSYAETWWKEHAAEYDLPPLEEISWTAVAGRVEDLPEPWNGLGAILTWIDASTGNPFIDLTCDELYRGGYDIGWDWDVDTLDFLAGEYAEAEADVFGPANHLDYLVAHNPAMLRTCIDLALGRCDALVWDGELILMDEGISLEGMPADLARLHVDPRVRYGQVCTAPLDWAMAEDEPVEDEMAEEVTA